MRDDCAMTVLTQAEAEAMAAEHPDRMRAYQCPDNPDYWHVQASRKAPETRDQGRGGRGVSDDPDLMKETLRSYAAWPVSPGDHTHVALTDTDVSNGMPHCRDCKWWEATDDLPLALDSRTAYGSCAKARTRGNVALDARAFAFESNYWSADLITAADFGCVQFEPRE